MAVGRAAVAEGAARGVFLYFTTLLVLADGLAMHGVPLVPFALLCVYSLGLIFGVLFFVALIAIGTPWLFLLHH